MSEPNICTDKNCGLCNPREEKTSPLPQILLLLEKHWGCGHWPEELDDLYGEYRDYLIRVTRAGL